MSATDLILMIALIALGLLVLWFMVWSDRRRIQRLFNQRGDRIIRLERGVGGIRCALSERNTTFWRVAYRTHDGSEHVAKCFASFLRVKVYDDEPAEEG